MAFEERDILLRMALQGMAPQDVDQAVRGGADALRQKLANLYAELDALHRKSVTQQTDDQKKQTAEQIADAEKKGKAYLKILGEIERAEAKAAKEGQTNWRRLLEDMENVTVVAQGAIGAIGGMVGAFTGAVNKALEYGDEIVRVTNIHRAFKGDIESLRRATGGEIADIDLMVTHNRALAAGLNLTAEEFEKVASAADNFADAVGGSTEEGLTTLIQSLTAGNEKAFKMLGIVIDNTEANKKWAASHQTVVEAMTDEQKLSAFRAVAIEKLGNAALAAGPKMLSFADAIEKAKAKWKGSGAVLAAVGNMGMISEFDAERQVLNEMAGVGVGVGANRGVPGMDNEEYLAKLADIARRERESLDAQQAALQARVNDARYGTTESIDALYAGPNATPEQLKAMGKEVSARALKEAEEAKKKAEAALVKKREVAKIINELFRPMRVEAARVKKERELGFAGTGVDIGNATESMQTDDADDLFGSKSADMSGKALIGDLQDQLEAAEKRAKDAKEKADEAAAKMLDAANFGLEQDLDKSKAAAAANKRFGSAGALSKALFGDKSSEETIADIRMVQDALVDTTLALTGIGDAGGKSGQRIVHDLLANLAKAAAGKAIWHTVEGVAFALSGNPLAGAEFAKAAAYAGAATALGGAAAAVGTGASPSAGGSPSGGARPVGNAFGGSSFSGPRAPEGAAAAPVNINLTVYPGGEAEAGRAVEKALRAWSAQNGRLDIGNIRVST